MCLRHSCKSGIAGISSSKLDSTRCWVSVFLWRAAVGILEVRSLQVGSAQCMLSQSLSAKFAPRRPCVVLRVLAASVFAPDKDCVVPSVALGLESARARTGNAAASVVSSSFLNADVLELVPRTSVFPDHSCFLGVIAIFCNDVQILQCLASQAIKFLQCTV